MRVAVRSRSASTACCFVATHCLRAPGPASQVLARSLHSCPPPTVAAFLSTPPLIVLIALQLLLIYFPPPVWMLANVPQHVCLALMSTAIVPSDRQSSSLSASSSSCSSSYFFFSCSSMVKHYLQLQ